MIKPMTFIHRFRSGCLGTLVLSLEDPESGRVHAEFTWRGPQPRLKGERLAWTMDYYQRWSDHTGQETFFIAVFHDGSNKAWRIAPHQKPVLMFRNMDGYALPNRPFILTKHTCIP
jgi:hypothetical protein